MGASSHAHGEGPGRAHCDTASMFDTHAQIFFGAGAPGDLPNGFGQILSSDQRELRSNDK